MFDARSSNKAINFQKLPEWESILSLYAPFVMFCVALFSGNLATVISMGFVQVAAICLAAMIVANIGFRNYKFESGFPLLVYMPIIRLGTTLNIVLFLLVVTERLLTNPAQSIALFILMFLLLAYSIATIEMSSSQSMLAFGTHFLKMMFAAGIVIRITAEQGTWISDQLEKLIGFVLPMAAPIHIDLLGVLVFFVGGGLLIWFIQVLFAKVASLVRLLLRRQGSALALRIAIVFAQVAFAVLALYL